MTTERGAMTPERVGSVWMQDKKRCISVARAVATDCMNALGLDAADFRTRDKIISAIGTRINQSMDAASNLSRATEPVAFVGEDGMPKWIRDGENGPSSARPTGTILYANRPNAEPDLYWALKGLHSAMACYAQTPEEVLALDVARAALAKASA